MHDQNWYYRQTIIHYIRKAFKDVLSKDTFQTYFYHELIELLNDEDTMVRLETIETAIEVMPGKVTPE